MTREEFQAFSREEQQRLYQQQMALAAKTDDLIEPDERTEEQSGHIGNFLGALTKNAINSALFGIPRFLLDPNNKHIFKEENTKFGQAGKITGDILGMIGPPTKLALSVGKKVTGMATTKLTARAAKTAPQATVETGSKLKQLLFPTTKEGIERTARLAGSTAGFASYDVARASEKDETLGDRLIGVPVSAAIGAGFGLAGEVIAPLMKKPVKVLSNFYANKVTVQEAAKVQKQIVGSISALDKSLRRRVVKLQREGNFEEANKIIQKAFTGSKKVYLDGQNAIRNSAVYKMSQQATEEAAMSPFVQNIIASTKGIVDKTKALPLWKKLEDYHKKAGYNWLIIPGETFISNLGKSGKAFVKGAKEIENFKNASAGPLIAKYQRAFDGLSAEEKGMFAKLVENPSTSANGKSRLERLAGEWKKDSESLLQELNNSGFKVEGVKNYFPHMMVDHKAAKNVIDRVIKDTADAEGMTDEAARKLWDSWASWLKGKEDPHFVEWMIKNRGLKAETVVGSLRELVKSRSGEINSSFEALNKNFGSMAQRPLNLPFWNRDPEATLQSYIYAQKQRVAESKIWGVQDKNLISLLTNMGKEGSDPVISKRVAQFIMDSMNGNMGRRHAFGLINPELNEQLRGFEVITKLGLASVMNASQSVSTASFTNISTTVKNMYKYLSSSGTRREMQIRAIEMGATLDGSLSEALNGLGADGSFMVLGQRVSPRNFLKKTGFLALEKMNRVIAAHAGRDFALRMSRELLETATVKGTPAALKTHQARALERMGLMPKKIIYQNGRISPQEFAKAARETVSKTQFSSGLLDLPLWWSSPEGKLTTQFKQFSYKQAILIKTVMLDEIAKGNYRPLLTFLAAGAVVGEVASDVRSIVAYRKRNPKGFDRLLDNLSAVGAGGIFHDLIKQQAYGNTAGYLLGPAINDVMKASEAGIQAATGKTTKAQNMLVKNIPVAGPALMNLRRSPDPQARLQEVLQGATGG